VIDGAAFYCMSSGLYFLGTVGLINSLRLHGHTEPIFVLDCGLSEAQRALLAPHVALVRGQDERHPFMLKTVAPRKHPARVMILIDVDIVVTRPLTELIELAWSDGVVAAEHRDDRFVPQWGELLGRGVTRRRRYLSSALLLLGGSLGHEVLRLMDEYKARVDFDRTMFRTTLPDYPFGGRTSGVEAGADYPFFYADQDLLNAIVATWPESERIVGIDHRLAPIPPFRELRLIDESALRCAYRDGTEPYLVHHHTTKPWLEPTHHGIYSRLLRRLLVGPDVALRVPQSELPLRLRTGPLAYAERKRVNAREHVRWHLREPLSARIRTLRGRVAGRRR
jgi:hypothetical protein